MIEIWSNFEGLAINGKIEFDETNHQIVGKSAHRGKLLVPFPGNHLETAFFQGHGQLVRAKNMRALIVDCWSNNFGAPKTLEHLVTVLAPDF